MPLSLADYRAMMRLSPQTWDPNPFVPHLGGPWHSTNFEKVVVGVMELLKRFDAGEVTEWQLLRGNDTDQDRCDTLSYWLYYQHHPRSAKWKLMGQRYWSVEAWRTWRTLGGGAFPRRKRYGDLGRAITKCCG